MKYISVICLQIAGSRIGRTKSQSLLRITTSRGVVAEICVSKKLFDLFVTAKINSHTDERVLWNLASLCFDATAGVIRTAAVYLKLLTNLIIYSLSCAKRVVPGTP